MWWKSPIFDAVRIINQHLLPLLLRTWAWNMRVIIDLASRPSTIQAFGFRGDALVKPMLAHAAHSLDHFETGLLLICTARQA
jgi:hypothetical protein